MKNNNKCKVKYIKE